jgi:hypothetical protein
MSNNINPEMVYRMNLQLAVDLYHLHNVRYALAFLVYRLRRGSSDQYFRQM